jgi:transketolase
VKAGEFAGKNLNYGIREHAMGSISNGLALSGFFIPFGSTFLIFSDYQRPAVRLASLMEQRVVFVYTHDSVFLGEDGPTHQPVEHLASLRAMPNLNVFSPSSTCRRCASSRTSTCFDRRTRSSARERGRTRSRASTVLPLWFSRVTSCRRSSARRAGTQS